MSENPVLLGNVDEIKAVWEFVFEDMAEDTPLERILKKPDFEEEAIDRLKNLGGLLFRVPEPLYELAVVWNAIWYYGGESEQALRLWQDRFPIRSCWVVNIKVAKIPLIFVKRQLLERVNQPNKFERKPGRKVPKGFKADCCYLWSEWLPTKWSRHTPLTDDSAEVRSFLSGEYLPPSIEFAPVGNTDWLASPVLPVSMPSHVFCIRRWGFFKEALLRPFTPVPANAQAVS